MTLRIGVLRGLGGNGGTFVTRALAALPSTVVLSETNPRSANLFGYALNPVGQVAQRYPSLGERMPDEHPAALGSPALFGAYLEKIARSCRDQGLRLIVRDYNYVDYVGTPFVWPTSFDSSLDAAVKHIRGRVELVECALIRHPLDQFASLRRHVVLSTALDPRCFLIGYLAFLRAHGKTRYRFEDVFADFTGSIEAIAESLELPYDPGFLDRIGSIAITGHVRGLESTQPIPPAARSEEVLSLRTHLLREKLYRKACKQAGYAA